MPTSEIVKFPTSPTDLFIYTLLVSPHSLQVAKLDAHNLKKKEKPQNYNYHI